MPHLMNCRHLGDGWCLDCVKELHDCRSDLLAACKAALDNDESSEGFCGRNMDDGLRKELRDAIAKAEAAP